MKKLLGLIMAGGALTVVTGCHVHFAGSNGNSSDADLTATTNIVQTAEIPASLKGIDVDNRFGAIHITGTENGKTGWTWKLGVRARTDAIARQIAADTHCDATMDGDQLKLVVSLPVTREPHSIESDLEIQVPKAATAHAQNRFGRIEIANLTGDVEATDQNDRVDLRNIAGSVHATTSFDSLTVSNTGSAILKNQNGEIRATVIGGPLEARTSFDSLIIRDVRGPATLANQNGSINVTGIRGMLDAETSFDRLVAKDIEGGAKLHNQNGRIEVADVAGALEARTSFDSLEAREIGGAVRLHDQNGRIKIIHAKGDADIETSFDSLDVEGVRGNAILRNQNGSVAASGVSGSVKASTSFASMDLEGDGTKFTCHNQNGAIRLRATSAALTNIEAQTSFDTLEIHLAANLKPVIQARTTFGDIESDYPVVMKPRGQDPFAGVAPEMARITLQNENGRIGVVRD